MLKFLNINCNNGSFYGCTGYYSWEQSIAKFQKRMQFNIFGSHSFHGYIEQKHSFKVYNYVTEICSMTNCSKPVPVYYQTTWYGNNNNQFHKRMTDLSISSSKNGHTLLFQVHRIIHSIPHFTENALSKQLQLLLQSFSLVLLPFSLIIYDNWLKSGVPLASINR